MKLTWTIISVFLPFFSSNPCELDYGLLIAVVFALLGYFIFRKKTTNCFGNPCLMSVVIIGSLGLLRLIVEEFYYCAWSWDTVINLSLFIQLLIILIVGYGLNDIRNHKRLKGEKEKI